MDKSYTITEIADKLGVSAKTLRRWEESGRFTPSRTLGDQRRYSLEDLQILDAIKHGTIPSQSDLLTRSQAAAHFGVTEYTLERWENEGKIHPFITAGRTFYPMHRLKTLDLASARQAPAAPPRLMEPVNQPRELTTAPTTEPPVSAPQSPSPKPVARESAPRSPLSPLPIAARSRSLTARNFDWKLVGVQTMITLVLLAGYHLLSHPKLVSPSPESGSVQGAFAVKEPILDILKQILDDNGSVTARSVTSKAGITSPSFTFSGTTPPANPAPGTLYFDTAVGQLKLFQAGRWQTLGAEGSIKVGNLELITGSAVIPAGQSQVLVSEPGVSAASAVTVTFTADYAPAKKYWVTAGDGSFTVHTDFPVSASSPFNYSLLAPAAATPSALPSSAPSAAPSATSSGSIISNQQVSL